MIEGMRHMNPRGDRAVRELERAVAAGDPHAVGPLVAARMRAGTIDVERARWAELLSRPIDISPACDWSPASDWLPRGSADPHPDYAVALDVFNLMFANSTPMGLAPDPRTVVLNDALRSLLMPVGGIMLEAITPRDVPSALQRWAQNRGFGVFENTSFEHPPYEILGDDTRCELDDDDDIAACERRFQRILETYLRDKPDGWTLGEERHLGDQGPEGFADDAARYYVRVMAARGNQYAIRLLAFLRRRSTLHYVEVLSPYTTAPLWHAAYHGGVRAPWQPEEGMVLVPFGVREHEVVSSLLGGAPL